MADQKKLDFEIPVSGRLSETLVKKVDRMAERSWLSEEKCRPGPKAQTPHS